MVIPKPNGSNFFQTSALASVLAAVVLLTATLTPKPTEARAPIAKQMSYVEKVTNRKENIAQYLTQKYKKPYPAVREIVELAWEESAKHPDVPPELVLAVIQKESSLNEKASSSYGAKGYMQVVSRFHKEKLKPRESLHDAEVNIRVGTQILQEYLALKNGNLRAALKKYSGNAKGYADFIVSEIKTLKKIS